MYGLTLVFSQKRRRSVGLRFLCSVHLRTSTNLWLWCENITVWRASCQTVVAGAHTWGVQECGASASTIASAIGKRALLFGYTAGLIVARGAVLLGFGLWCCLVGSSRTVGAFTGTCRTFVGWFRVCGVAVLSGFRIIKALRAVSLCGVGEVNFPPCARTYSVSRDW